MSKLIAVNGCNIIVTNGIGNVSIETSPSSYVKIDNKGAYRGTLTIKVSNFTGAKINSGVGIGTLSPNAATTKIDGMFAVLEGAECDVLCSGYDIKTGKPDTETANVKIVSAGQNYVSEA